VLLSFVLGSLFFVVVFVIFGALLYLPVSNLPFYLANSWRLKASSQMVLAIFYIVTYMRQNSNLELAISFAADHLGGPLGLDFRRVIWNVETEKFSNVKESLDVYLETWKKWNMEFIEAMHLIEGSLFESADERRLDMLDKSLSVILEETYEKMLHYAQNLKSPITMLHMLGIILPILTLVILPLLVSFMNGIHWYHLAAFYNFFLPLGVYYLGKNILSSRPTGYGDTDISEHNPSLTKKSKTALMTTAVIIFVVCLIIALSPVWIQLIIPGVDFGYIDNGIQDPAWGPIYGVDTEGIKYSILGFKYAGGGTDTIIGPFGLGAALISFFFPIALGFSVWFYMVSRSKNVLEIRTRAKKLEAEFASALFQLGNRLGDGIPAEIAFQRVAEAVQGSISGEFFETVASNITRLGMDVESAVFDSKVGAINIFPSEMVETSMKILVESSKKGPLVAAQALINVSRYIKEMHRVDERLKDLLAEIISSMKSQIGFMTPAIAGIVVGITSMVTEILGKLGGQLTKISSQSAAAGGGMGLTTLFGDGLPTFYFQMIVGIYVMQITYILTIITNGIENGEDKLNERYLLGKNMRSSAIRYVLTSAIVMLLFNIIAANIIGKK